MERNDRKMNLKKCQKVTQYHVTEKNRNFRIIMTFNKFSLLKTLLYCNALSNHIFSLYPVSYGCELNVDKFKNYGTAVQEKTVYIYS